MIIKGSPKDPLVVEKNMVTIHTTIKAKNKLKSLGKKEGCDENTRNTGKLYIDENIIKSFIQNCRKYNWKRNKNEPTLHSANNIKG